MEHHLLLGDNELEHLFENAQLDPRLFSHEAHLRLAWIHLNKYGEINAIKNLTDQIPVFAKKHGAPGKYNTTLTVAAIKAVYHFYKKSASSNFQDFIVEFPRLKTHFTALMAAHYSFDIYHSQEAKSEFLAPDLLPFD